MTDQTKKILTIAGIIIGVALIILTVYFYLQNVALKRELNAARQPSPTATVRLITATPIPSRTITQTPEATATVSAEEAIKQAIAAKYNTPDAQITIDKRSENAAFGTISMSGGGGWFVAVRDGDTWKVIADGNGTIECSVLDENDVPSSVVSECYDTPSGQTRTR